MTDAIIKLFALYIGVKYGLVTMFAGSSTGVFATLGHWAWGLFMIAVAIGFWRRQGWAFLVVSIGLLASWLIAFITIVVAVDQGQSLVRPVIGLLAVMASIAYFGRWKMEKRFRPHLELDH